MLPLRRACSNRSLHLLLVTVLVATLVILTFDYGKYAGKSELLDQITSGRVQDTSLLNRLKNAVYVEIQNSEISENSKSTRKDGSDQALVWQSMKVDKGLKPKQKAIESSSGTEGSRQSSHEKMVQNSTATRSFPLLESISSAAKLKTSKSMESESKSTKHKIKPMTEVGKAATDNKLVLQPKEPNTETKGAKDAKTTTANKPKPKPPATVKPIEKKGPPRLPSDIIDVDKVYPDHPPDITWRDDVIIQLPLFDATKPVPKILHLGWYSGVSGTDSTKRLGTDLKLHHYISFLSAYKRLKPKRILFWHNERPAGRWWDSIYEITKSVLQMVKRASPKEIFGNPIVVPAHHSDVVRLEAVMYYGGVYIDLDVIILKDFAPLYTYDTTMGWESEGALCNGIIVSKPVAPFLKLWYDHYRTFDDSRWSEHSVFLPGRLAKKNATLIHTEESSMNKPDYIHLNQIFGEGVYYNWTDNYSIHLWYRMHGVEHTIEEINKMNSTFGQISRYTLYNSPDIIGPNS